MSLIPTLRKQWQVISGNSRPALSTELVRATQRNLGRQFSKLVRKQRFKRLKYTITSPSQRELAKVKAQKNDWKTIKIIKY